MKHSFWIVSNMSEIINLNVGLFGVLGRDDRARERWNMIKNAQVNFNLRICKTKVGGF